MKQCLHRIVVQSIGIALLGISALTHAGPILTVAGNNTAAAAALGDRDLSDGIEYGGFAMAFELDRAFTDVSLSAPIICPIGFAADPNDPLSSPQLPCSGEMFFLGGAVGAPNIEILAATDFQGSDFNQEQDGYTTLFSGLDLGPGIYQFVMSVETTFAVWGGTNEPFTAVDGVRALNSWFTDDNNAGAPWESNNPGGWNRLLGLQGDPAEYYYTLSAAMPVAGVPEPQTWALLLLGFMGLGALRANTKPQRVVQAEIAK